MRPTSCGLPIRQCASHSLAVADRQRSPALFLLSRSYFRRLHKGSFPMAHNRLEHSARQALAISCHLNILGASAWPEEIFCAATLHGATAALGA
jgi:hypothetical protein